MLYSAGIALWAGKHFLLCKMRIPPGKTGKWFCELWSRSCCVTQCECEEGAHCECEEGAYCVGVSCNLLLDNRLGGAISHCHKAGVGSK